MPTRQQLAVAGIFACALVAYGTALAGTFVYDDLHSVRDNEALRSLGNVPSFFVDLDAFSSLDIRMYRPVLLLTLALNHAVAGLEPWFFKLTNVLLHGACAALCYSLARCLRADFRSAVFAGLLFAAHPLASEAVNLVSARSDQLMVFGLLLGMRLHFAAMAGVRWAVVGTALAAAIACGGKETGALLPGCLLVLEFLRARRRGFEWRGAALRLAAPVAVVALYLLCRKLLFGFATARVPLLSGGHDVMNGAGRDLVTQLCTMTYVLPRFTGQSVVPVGLTIDPFVAFTDAWWSPPVICGAGFLLILTWLGVRAPRRAPGVFAGTCIAWATALPWVLIPLNLPACEHRFYGALAGLALVLAAALPGRWLRRRGGVLGAAACVLLFVGLAAHRSLDYTDPAILWTKCLRGHPNSVRGLCGTALARQNEAVAARLAGDEETFRHKVEEGLGYLHRAVSVYSDHRAARRNVAEFNLALGPEHGEPFTAVVMADYLCEREPQNPFHRLLLSRALAQAGQRSGRRQLFDEAERAALSCLEIAEPKGLVYRTAAQARDLAGDLEGAVGLLDQSVERGLDHKTVLLHRAELLDRLGRRGAAWDDLQRVLRGDPFDADALRLIQRVGSARPAGR